MGDITQYSVTHNGQFVFSAVSRGKWALRSMERLVQVCAYLQDNPNDPFLDKWRSACHGSPVRRCRGAHRCRIRSHAWSVSIVPGTAATCSPGLPADRIVVPARDALPVVQG